MVPGSSMRRSIPRVADPLVIVPDMWNEWRVRMAAAASWITCTGDLLLSAGGPVALPALPHADTTVAPIKATIRLPARRCSKRLEVPGMATPSG